MRISVVVIALGTFPIQTNFRAIFEFTLGWDPGDTFESLLSGTKKEHKPKLLSPIFFGGVGVLHVKGWGPKSSVCPSKPGKSISRRCPKSLRNKSLCSIFVPNFGSLNSFCVSVELGGRLFHNQSALRYVFLRKTLRKLCQPTRTRPKDQPSKPLRGRNGNKNLFRSKQCRSISRKRPFVHGLAKGGLAQKAPIGPKRALSGQFLLFPRGCGVRRNWSRSAPKRPR